MSYRKSVEEEEQETVLLWPCAKQRCVCMCRGKARVEGGTYPDFLSLSLSADIPDANLSTA